MKGKTILGFRIPTVQAEFLNTIEELYKNKDFASVANMLYAQFLSNKSQAIQNVMEDHFEVLYPTPLPNASELALKIEIWKLHTI